MIYIRSLTLNLGKDGWGSLSGSPVLIINVKETSDRLDILSIDYVFTSPNDSQTGTIDPDFLAAVTTQLVTSENRGRWITADPGDINLITELEKILSEFNDEDKFNMASPYTVLFNLDAVSLAGDIEQNIIDVFVAEIATYLVFASLLYNGAMWPIMPFCWQLPCNGMDNRVLTKNVMDYFMIPLDTTKITACSFIREIIWVLSSFHSVWSHSYIAGDVIDTQEIIHNVVMNTVQSTVKMIDEAKEEVRIRTDEAVNRIYVDSVSKGNWITENITEIRMKIDDLDERIGPKAVAEYMPIIESRIANMESKFHTIISRVDDLNAKFNKISEAVRELNERVTVLEATVL